MSKFSVTLPAGAQVLAVESGKSVLEAALRQQFVLPYCCKNGCCGTCKGRIVSGEVHCGIYQANQRTNL